ncbi:MAG: YeeE/YedE family protein, partial [Pseudomonadota bacterium]
MQNVSERSTQILPITVGMALIFAVTILAGVNGGTKLALASLIGAFAGLALYHASFGFTAAWRRMVREKR